MQTDEQNWPATSITGVVNLCSSNAKVGLSSQEALLRLKQNGSFGLKEVPSYKLSFMFYKVIRDGTIKNVALNELAFGDVVLFKKDDVVPAKVRLLKVDGLAVQEQNVSGIAAPAYKNTFNDNQDRLNGAVSKNMLYPKSYVLKGKAVGIIVDKPLKLLNTIKPVKKFLKKGLFMPKSIVKLLQSSNLIIFDGLSKPEDILATVQSIAIKKQIPCVYFLPPSLAIEWSTLIPESNTSQYDSNSLISIFNSSIVNKAKVVTLFNKKYKSLYIYSGSSYEPAASIAGCDIALTDQVCPLAVLRTKIIANNINVNDLSCFLYNKK